MAPFVFFLCIALGLAGDALIARYAMRRKHAGVTLASIVGGLTWSAFMLAAGVYAFFYIACGSSGCFD